MKDTLREITYAFGGLLVIIIVVTYMFVTFALCQYE